MNRKQLVEKNLRLLESREEGGMTALIGSESMGGNTGYMDGAPASALNFACDRQTGEIFYFANIQHIPLCFRHAFMATMLYHDSLYALQTTSGKKPQPPCLKGLVSYRGLSKEAKSVIDESMVRYNLKAEAYFRKQVEQLGKKN